MNGKVITIPNKKYGVFDRYAMKELKKQDYLVRALARNKKQLVEFNKYVGEEF